MEGWRDIAIARPWCQSGESVDKKNPGHLSFIPPSDLLPMLPIGRSQLETKGQGTEGYRVEGLSPGAQSRTEREERRPGGVWQVENYQHINCKQIARKDGKLAGAKRSRDNWDSCQSQGT